VVTEAGEERVGAQKKPPRRRVKKKGSQRFLSHNTRWENDIDEEIEEDDSLSLGKEAEGKKEKKNDDIRGKKRERLFRLKIAGKVRSTNEGEEGSRQRPQSASARRKTL